MSRPLVDQLERQRNRALKALSEYLVKLIFAEAPVPPMTSYKLALNYQESLDEDTKRFVESFPSMSGVAEFKFSRDALVAFQILHDYERDPDYILVMSTNLEEIVTLIIDSQFQVPSMPTPSEESDSSSDLRPPRRRKKLRSNRRGRNKERLTHFVSFINELDISTFLTRLTSCYKELLSLIFRISRLCRLVSSATDIPPPQPSPRHRRSSLVREVDPATLLEESTALLTNACELSLSSLSRILKSTTALNSSSLSSFANLNHETTRFAKATEFLAGRTFLILNPVRYLT